MKQFRLIIVIIFIIAWLVSCVPTKRKAETIPYFYKTEKAIAVENLIQKYEKEHQKFYKEEIKDGEYLEWPALDNKNLSNYCKKYLQISIPGTTINSITGTKITKTLHYEKEHTSTISKVVIVQCEDIDKSHQNTYYMMRAPEPSCIYDLKSTGEGSGFILSIINKYCDFEDIPLINMPLKRQRLKIICKMDELTGQPIAKVEYILEYELEHIELFRREGINGELLEWPQAMVHPNLNFLCYQYMSVCVPTRNRKGVRGIWTTENLFYQKLNRIEYVEITTVRCQAAYSSRLNYYITRAPQSNCVYALLEQGHNGNDHMVIIFKHCGLEERNEQRTTTSL